MTNMSTQTSMMKYSFKFAEGIQELKDFCINDGDEGGLNDPNSSNRL